MRVGPVSNMMSSALAAMQAGQSRILQAAAPIAEGDIDAIPESMMEMSLGKATFAVGVHLARTADEMYQSTLDLLA